MRWCNLQGKRVLHPPAWIGVVGGGQLGRMLAMEAKRMGYSVVVLDPTENSPAGQVADFQIVAPFSDKTALRKLAEQSDVITYEFEHIDAEALHELEIENHTVIPSSKTLKIIKDKYLQKMTLYNANLPVPPFCKIESKEDLVKRIGEFGLPVVLKARQGGYDGKGNFVIKSESDVDLAYEKLAGKDLMLEKYIHFVKELSILVARNFEGEVKFYPVVENIHEENILRITKVPAQIDSSIKSKVEQIARKVVEVLNDCGIFCIELFLDSNGQVFINEIAPRPHNSGHYTIEACVTSQFEQLVRILTGMPLGSTQLISPCVMVNILGNDEVFGKYTVEGLEKILSMEKVYLHLYGKSTTSRLRKLGHITVLDENVEKAERKALETLSHLKIKPL
ncbi:5-(carboxyamino)imidazole ribonucleotide synthase [Pseudothermotoga thermarum]|uniref:N5-carboxyaminoimidazole ribonucleotide synthase n=1 Tax=Pseudothermotoga thermarum DSM 5069 TaxID=688269 RepID=F7YV08_9THEM|nr:5-(carboxyamino)imidazole ribonucleotide synthase [Pseudothermotoga thermarum]AEH50292.1 phosphoribosylaminoimidazole carboxylase, ATPase subunit [Pseudothermotoga thermarum DSM 5069]